MHSIGKPSKKGFIFCASVLVTLLAACGGGDATNVTPTATPSTSPTGSSTAAPTAAGTPIATVTATPGATATNTPVPTATNTASPTATASPSATAIPTTPAQLNASLLGSYNKAFYQGSGAGCGTVCSYTEGQTVAVALLAGNVLSLDGRQLSNPYFRILGGSPHTPEIIWRDGDIEYALTNNDSGLFSEINVGDLATPMANGFPRYLGQIRDVVITGIANVTQFQGAYAKGFQYAGPVTGNKAPTWTGLTIAADGAITFTGGTGTGQGPSLTPAQIDKVQDFTGCCGSVLVTANINTTIGDTLINSNDHVRLFRNAAGQLSAVEYYVDSSNYVGVLLGTPAALPAHSGAAIPSSYQVSGTANSIAYPVALSTGQAYSNSSAGGINLNATTGTGNAQQQWFITAGLLGGPLTSGTTFSCQKPNSGNDVAIQFNALSRNYRSLDGGRCLITVTAVTSDSTGITSFEGTFVAELYTFKRDLAPLIINDGVFRWVKP